MPVLPVLPVLPARATVVAVALAICTTLLVGGSAHAADRRPDGLTGYAFDARCAPTQAEMDAWLTASPFWGVGVYIGGSTASCQTTATDPGQPHLFAGCARAPLAARIGANRRISSASAAAGLSSHTPPVSATPSDRGRHP